MAEDMPLSELLSPDSSRAVVSASQQTAEILQLLRRLEAVNRYPAELAVLSAVADAKAVIRVQCASREWHPPKFVCTRCDHIVFKALPLWRGSYSTYGPLNMVTC